jgi:hypothetical protein
MSDSVPAPPRQPRRRRGCRLARTVLRRRR